MRRARRRGAVAVGVLAFLPVVLVGTLPAVARQLADRHDSAHHEAAFELGGSRVHRALRVSVTGAPAVAFSPGLFVPIGMTIRNPNPHPVRISRISVTVIRIVAPHADALHPCTRLDYEIQQMPERTLRLPARTSMDLVGLRLAPQSWPQLGMRNLPVNQDGCKGARLTLGYRAHAVKEEVTQ